MRKIVTAVAALILTGASVPVGAWWANPFTGWFQDWFGNAGFNFSVNFSMQGNGWGRGPAYGYWNYYPYGAPYWGPFPTLHAYPYEGFDAPHGLAPRDARSNPLPATESLRQAVESQRVLVEGLTQRPAQAPGSGPLQSPAETLLEQPAAPSPSPGSSNGHQSI